MSTKKLTLSAILLAMGLALHYMMPGIIGAMKIDIQLAMLFIAIMICKDYKSTVALGIVSGILTAVTTTFPGGQLPNIIDKIVTVNVVFLIMFLTQKLNAKIRIFLISTIGTLCSGTVFLSTAALIVGLPPHASFTALFISVVIPAVVANTIIVYVIYGIIDVSLKSPLLNKN